MAIAVRRASGGDFNAVHQFICELQDRYFDKVALEGIYLKNISHPDHIYLVAVEGSNVVGYGSCHIQHLLHHGGKVAEIQEMFVASGHRNKGTGKLLMAAMKEAAKAKGALQLEVTTRAVREAAIRFYMGEGFEDSHKKLVHYFQNF